MGLLVTALVVIGAALGVMSAKYQHQPPGPRPADIEGLLWPKPKTLTPFTAIDHKNNTFTLSGLNGKWSFLFFGYTNCPDVCPITLSVMDKVHQALARSENPPDMQTLFISVDPERDTPEKLDQYVTYFNPGFIGLGGSVEQVRGLTKQIGVAYYLNKTSDTENYLVDHSASLFLIDPKGRLIAIFSAPHEAAPITSKFNQIRKLTSKEV